MEYRSLGRTGVQVSALCLGCMLFGDDTSEEESIRIIHRALDAGINFLDTADVYSQGVSEQIVGRALSGGKRDRVFLATKFYNRMGDGPNDRGGHRHYILRACEASLRRLNTDWIDLYQMHRPHPAVPIDETLRALDDLIRQGKVRYIGTSTFAAWQIVEALWVSKELHLNRFVCEQPPYNLLDRRVERELLPMCRTYGIATIPWAPLAGGLLTGKYRPGQPRPADARYAGRSAPFNRDNEVALQAVERYVAFCEQRGFAPADCALAWVLAQPGVTSPIIGPRTLQHLEDSLRASTLRLTAEDLAALDALFPPGTHVSDYYRADFGPNARWL
ncbi:MAG: aldo/keto reductase [Chloroherpetonaceae bacterium]|nr:aldo/keto reductase [Chthonomonadaceae bacterium]MDW8208821.1 aldo/keto reductase [Chloroherpetonaceae bacterium]